MRLVSDWRRKYTALTRYKSNEMQKILQFYWHSMSTLLNVSMWIRAMLSHLCVDTCIFIFKYERPWRRQRSKLGSEYWNWNVVIFIGLNIFFFLFRLLFVRKRIARQFHLLSTHLECIVYIYMHIIIWCVF